MTTAAVRKNLAEKLLKALQEDFKKPLTRGSRANVLFLDNLDFINKTIQQVQSNYPDLIPNQKTLKFTANDLSSARKIASRYQDDFCKIKVYKGGVPTPANTAVGRYLMGNRPEVWSKIDDGSAFILL